MKYFQKPTSIRTILIAGVFSFLTAYASDSASYPFPQHLNYGTETIMPDQYSQEWMDDDVTVFYDYWKKEYLAEAGEDNKGNPLFRIALGHPESSNYGTTVSEGQAYGMLIVSLMAGYDTDAKSIFDGLWRFAKQHPSGINPRLMAWRVSEDDPDAGDNDSAFDGDADIAFALLVADRQWGSDMQVNYAGQAKNKINAIYRSTIGPDSKLPMLGDWVEKNGSEYNQYTNRTSDFMLANFQAFFRFTEHNRWKRVTNKSRRATRYLQKTYSATAGLLPDFIIPVSSSDHTPKPADPYFLEGENDGKYNYNACRVPLRIGMDALLNKNKVSRNIVRRISKWAKKEHNSDPYDIRAGYNLKGNPVSGSNYFSTAFVAPLGIAAMNMPKHQVWLNNIYDAVNQEHQDYYEDTLNLLSLLIMTGNFWDPTNYKSAL